MIHGVGFDHATNNSTLIFAPHYQGPSGEKRPVLHRLLSTPPEILSTEPVSVSPKYQRSVSHPGCFPDNHCQSRDKKETKPVFLTKCVGTKKSKMIGKKKYGKAF